MDNPAKRQSAMARMAHAQTDRAWVLLVAAIGTLAGGYFLPDPRLHTLALSIGMTLLALFGLIHILARSLSKQRSGLAHTLSGFIEHDTSPSFTTDFDGVILHQNKVARERFGERKGETLARSLRDFFANPSAVLLRLRSKVGTLSAAREDIVTRRGHVRLAVHDVGADTYLWRLEDMVERSAASGRGAELLSLPMMTASKSGTILFMNEAMRRILGGRERSLDAVFADLPLESDSEHTVKGADGPIRARVVQIEGAGGRQEIFLMPINDSASHSSSAVPAQGADWNDVPVALLEMSREGKLLRFNRQATQLLGGTVSTDMALGQLVEGLGRSIRDWLEEAADGRGSKKPEVVRSRKSDNDVFLQINLNPVTDGETTTLVAVLADATELKSLEAQFVQSQKMQAIGQLAGGVAHDFNNLLTAISGHCDLLLLRHDQGDPDYGDLVQINQNANRAASLVGQLLAFSRKQNLQPEVLDLRETMGELIHLLNRLVGERITLSLHHDPVLKPMRADKRQLEQVLMNLVVNARDAMPLGGEIKIETRMITYTKPVTRDRVVVPVGEYVLVKVTDEGSGIPKEQLSKIFEPFFTTKRTGEGTGLGLSTAYGIVKQTGGYIFVDSEVGTGTVFSLVFPVYDHPMPVQVQPSATAPVVRFEQGEGVVLLVEDEAPVRAFASRALRMRGYTVLEAENAEEALRTLEDEELQIDVFVTDVIMPGMNGPSWVKKALKARPGVKVVFVSGYAEDSFAEDQREIPNSVFLPKPFSLNELTATVQQQTH